MEKLAEVLGTGAAETGGQIVNRTAGEITCQAVQQSVTEAAGRRRLRRSGARANDEVEFAEPGGDPLRVLGRMLAVRIDDEDKLAVRAAHPGFHRRTVSLVVRMSDDARPGGTRLRRRLIRRAVVDDKDLAPRRR